MKHFLFLSALIFSVPAIANDFFLELEKQCMSTGNQLNFKCDKINQRVIIFLEGSNWYGKNPENGSTWELEVLKADKYILVLNNPVFFSGTSVLHLMKDTGKFYWSEFAYSDILEENEATVSYGTISKVHK